MNSIFEIQEIVIPISMGTIIQMEKTSLIPRWAEKEMHPELRGTGPKEYNKLLLGKQKDTGGIVGYLIYEHLKKTGNLEMCLSLQDGKVIKRIGITIFRKLFGYGTTIFLWKSVIKSIVKNKDGTDCLFVPYLCAGKKKLLLDWNCLSNKFSPKDLTILFGEN